ncbi:MAG TPA: sigma-70 family RNA polymerase sigma factor, partial [Kofleriaceae bacterium]|nr:sigma-70 family RNA polymerase sigma factor [Kofleriaceae bacterium]
QVEAALAALAEGDRALIVLRFRHGLDYAELAAAFGLREGTVRMRLSRALRRMRDALIVPAAPAAPAAAAPARARAAVMGAAAPPAPLGRFERATLAAPPPHPLATFFAAGADGPTPALSARLAALVAAL